MTLLIIPALLVLWMIYRRIRRTVGFQKVAVARISRQLIILGLAAVFIITRSIHQFSLLAADVVGLLIGVAIAYVAIRTTVFEHRSEGMYYKPHVWIGITLLVLFLGRLAYRFVEIYATYKSTAIGTVQSSTTKNQLYYQSDPLTFGVFFLLMTYYVCYSAFLLRREKQWIVEQSQ